MSEKSAVYECVDREHDAWRCRACGYIENFEADGPTENGWHFCPGCGREIIVDSGQSVSVRQRQLYVPILRNAVQQRIELL